MNIEWNKLRAFNGDIKNGFEELVCQLARVEPISNKDKFVRVGTPDGGVESFCILSDNSEYGWQAKFFSSVDDTQWKQLEKSFKTAFEKHPNLVKYFICIPLDRADPRITIKKGKRIGQRINHFMDKWNEKIDEWTAYAEEKEREIEFEYWGNSEIFERLARKENEGKLHYWFEKEEFSDDWFKNHLNESIKNLDKRYTPELNFELPIAKTFDGISRDKYFKTQFISFLDDFLKKYHNVVSNIENAQLKSDIDKIISLTASFRQEYEKIDFKEIHSIDLDILISKLEDVEEKVSNLSSKFYNLYLKHKREDKEKSAYTDTNPYGRQIEKLRNFNNSISEFLNFLHSYTVKLSNYPIMFLSGAAGVGKSHLLADIATTRLNRNQFSILLLGQQFVNDEPWNQIKNFFM